MATPLTGFEPSGFPAAQALAEKEEELYATPDELKSLFGVTTDIGRIRVVCQMINGHCNRPTLWPHEYEERLDLPSDRNQAILTYRPVMQVLFAAGRYAYGRRDRRTMNQVNYDYIAALAVFGSPPRFTAIDVNQIELYGPTGEIFLPTGFFLINYSQVQIKYLAGFTAIPGRIKAAVAVIHNSMSAKGVGDRTSYSVGGVSRTFQTAEFIDADAKRLLEPFVIRALV